MIVSSTWKEWAWLIEKEDVECSFLSGKMWKIITSIIKGLANVDQKQQIKMPFESPILVYLYLD
jgi:hypothetical protein